MATATELATRALRRIRVIAAGQTPAAHDMDAATEALDEMIASWETKALSGDVLPLDARFEQGLVAMLAVRLSGDYGTTPDAILMRDAMEGERAIGAAFFAVPEQQFDRGLTRTGQDSGADYLIGNGAANYTDWTSYTDYALRQMVYSAGNVYECTLAGTSGATGPTGTSSDEADGTVVWCWRRVSA